MVPGWKTNGRKRTLRDSFGDAARGILHTLKTERNARIHLTAAAYVLFFAPRLGVSRAEFAVLCLAIALVIAAETFNTALEMLCDYAQKSYNRFIGTTKDIAAGAVLICAVFAAFVGVAVLWRPEALLALAAEIFTVPLYCVLFFVSLLVAALFVFAGPVRIAEFFEKRFRRNK